MYGGREKMRAHLAAFFHRRVARRAQRQMQSYTVRRLSLQALFFAALVLVGLGLFHLKPVSQASGTSVSFPSTSFIPSETGRGAGNSVAIPGSPATPALCNPFDPACYVNSIGASTAQTILSGLQPVTDFFQNSSTNILTQTPPDDSYHNTMVETINQAL